MIERATAPGILMVSKPVRPPWNDSSKNLVKDLATAGRDFNYHVLTPDRYSLPGPAVVSEPIYHDGGRHSPALLQNVRVLARLLRPDRTVLTHFFYAPNPRTSAAARLALKIRPRIAVQTVCSTPASFEDPQKLLFGRRVVVLSEDTRQRFIGAGIAAERLVRIPPGIQLPPASTAREVRLARQHFGLPLDRPLVLYPGDYQFSNAAKTFALAAGRIRGVSPEPVFVLACRPKQRRSVVEAEEVQKILHSSGIRCRTRIFGELPDMLRLLRACDLCVLAPESLYAKMDLPLVLLEAMALGIPLVVSDRPPLSELLVDEVGLGVPPGDAEALAAAIQRLLRSKTRMHVMGLQAREAARRRYDIERVSAAHEALYQELLNQGREVASR